MLTHQTDELIQSTDLNISSEDTSILNIYSALVRKEDFENGTKLCQPLQKTPYVKVSGVLNAAIQKIPNSEIKRKIEEYTLKRSSINKRIPIWKQERIYPLVLLRVLSQNYEEFSSKIYQIEYVTDFLRKSRCVLPKTEQDILTPFWTYFSGCSLGDGHIEKQGKRWVLVDGTSKKDELIFSKKFVEDLKRNLSQYTPNINIVSHPTKIELKINNKFFCRYVEYFFGHPRGKKKERKLREPPIFKEYPRLRKAFWRGCFDTDGSVEPTGKIDFCSSDKNMLKECAEFLKTLDITPTQTKRTVNIPLADAKKFAEIGFAHPRKQNNFLKVLETGPSQKKLIKKKGTHLPETLINVLLLDKSDRIRVSKKQLKKENISKEEVNALIEQQFRTTLKEARNGLLYFKSKEAHKRISKDYFMNHPWEPITENDKQMLLKSWNEVWNL